MGSTDRTETVFCSCRESIKWLNVQNVIVIRSIIEILESTFPSKLNTITTSSLEWACATCRRRHLRQGQPLVIRYWSVNNSDTCTHQTWLFLPVSLHPDSSSGPVSCNNRPYLKCWIQNDIHLFLRRLFLTPCHGYTKWVMINFIVTKRYIYDYRVVIKITDTDKIRSCCMMFFQTRKFVFPTCYLLCGVIPVSYYVLKGCFRGHSINLNQVKHTL